MQLAEGWRMLDIDTQGGIVKFTAMAGLVLKHESETGEIQWSYYSPSTNTSIVRNRIHILSSSDSLKTFRRELEAFPVIDTVTSHFSRNSREKVYCVQTLLLRYYF